MSSLTSVDEAEKIEMKRSELESEALDWDRLSFHTRESVLNDYDLKLEQSKSAGIEADKLILAECDTPGEYFETLADLHSHEYRNEQPFILKNKS